MGLCPHTPWQASGASGYEWREQLIPVLEGEVLLHTPWDTLLLDFLSENSGWQPTLVWREESSCPDIA